MVEHTLKILYSEQSKSFLTVKYRIFSNRSRSLGKKKQWTEAALT